MIVSRMRFKDYVWDKNPLSVELAHSRSLQDGIRRRVLKGNGEFYGEDCVEQFERLRELFSQSDSAVLSVAGFAPMVAYFTALSIVADTTPDLITYSFEFTEEAPKEHKRYPYDSYVCTGDETLFDISYITGVSVDTLVQLNPWIRRPDELTAGERVRLC